MFGDSSFRDIQTFLRVSYYEIVFVRRDSISIDQPCILTPLSLIQAIKVATDDGIYGDQLSDEILQVADDLYHSRIPEKWTSMAGDVTPPSTWSLTAWFTDLSNRFSHIDRIVVQVLSGEVVSHYWYCQ